ncbi:MAG: S9 family peptidase [Acidobacteriota bacterium]
MNRQRHFLVLLIILFIAQMGFAQQTATDPSRLTLERIYSSNEFTPNFLPQSRWIDGGAGYTTLEASKTAQGRDIVRYDTATGGRAILVAAEKLIPAGQNAPLAIHNYIWSPSGKLLMIYTNSQKVWRLNTRGDYWVLDLNTGKLSKLGGDAKPATLMFAKFSPDNTRVAYVRENNLYVENLADHRITQLTSDGSRTIINGTFDWVYEEELDLRDGWRWSPDSKQIAYWQLDAEGVKNFNLINYTDELYSKVIPIQYPKAGESNSAARIGVVSAVGGATRWMQVPGDARNNYLARMDWAESAAELIIQQLNRLQNTNTVMLADAKTGGVRAVLTEVDKAWVDIYGDEVTWFDGGKSFLWVSERDGWRHVYVISRDGKTTRLVTKGEYDVVSIQSVDDAQGWLYFIASPENATQRYLYRAKLDASGKAERLSPASQSGWHSYNIAPNSSWAFHTYSSFGAPPRTELVRLPEHTVARVMVDNAALQAKVKQLKLGASEFFRVDIGEGLQLDGWMIKPPDFDASKKYPVLFYVYGEPAAQTVTDNWGGGNYLWHQMLAGEGYIVMSVDNRGTPAPRGREWRKIIYRQFGLVASQDEANAVRAISRWPFVDATRIGIWGWSGGGSSTLNALFRFPEVYRMGMAVAPVGDPRYYDTIYQERYMGLPQDHPDEYKRGAPVTFAHQLKGDLLIVHGTGDDNVHYQNSEAVINALIKANKPFTMMAYPNRTHGIFEGENTTRHLFELLTRFLREKLPAGGR